MPSSKKTASSSEIAIKKSAPTFKSTNNTKFGPGLIRNTVFGPPTHRCRRGTSEFLQGVVSAIHYLIVDILSGAKKAKEEDRKPFHRTRRSHVMTSLADHEFAKFFLRKRVLFENNELICKIHPVNKIKERLARENRKKSALKEKAPRAEKALPPPPPVDDIVETGEESTN